MLKLIEAVICMTIWNALEREMMDLEDSEREKEGQSSRRKKWDEEEHEERHGRGMRFSEMVDEKEEE